MYGTGSDEILQLAAGAFASVGDEVLFPRFGFSVYPIAARRVGAKPVEAPDRDYATDVDAMLAAVTERTRVVFLANPNNPTGTFASRDETDRQTGRAACRESGFAYVLVSVVVGVYRIKSKSK